MRKFTVPSVCFLLSLVLLAACGSSGFRTDADVSGVASAMAQAAPDSGGYFSVTDLSDFGDDAEGYTDKCIIYLAKTSGNQNEFGVFRAKSAGAAEKLKTVVRTYIDDKYEDFKPIIANYAPTEKDKYENADVRVFGQYVVYAILNGTDAKNAFSAAEAELKAD